MRNPDFQEIDRDFYGASAPAYQPPKPDLWQRMSRVMEGILYLLILAAILRIFWPEVEKQRLLNAELAQVEGTLGVLEGQLAELSDEYSRLKSDREYIEIVARDRLDRAKQEEWVVRIKRDEDIEVAQDPLPRVKPPEKP